MWRTFLKIFHFTRKERIGALALGMFCFCLYVTPELYYRFALNKTPDQSGFKTDIENFRKGVGQTTTAPDAAQALFEFDPNTASESDFQALGIPAAISKRIINYRTKGGKFDTPDDFSKIWGLPESLFQTLKPYIRIGMEQEMQEPRKAAVSLSEPFEFDPNTASFDDFLQLGLSEKTAKSIVNYREKGGKFYKNEDFKKIYTLRENDYTRLLPYIKIVTPTAAKIEQPVIYGQGATTVGPTGKALTKGPLDINRSNMEQWMQLPGIGEKRARQIVNFREKLGGFLTVEQVAETRGLPDSAYQKIKPWLVLENKDLRKININTVTVEDLSAHPYFSKKQAGVIVDYRTNHGAFKSVNDLYKIRAFEFEKGWLNKVLPYLGVE